MWINTNMALLKYFKKSSFLSNPNGPLSEQTPSSSIASSNREVQKYSMMKTLYLKEANMLSVQMMKE